MQAVVHRAYGAPGVLQVERIHEPSIGATQMLVRVHASPVTQGDRRMRSADFPGISWLPGRLMSGLLRPRHAVPGTAFAGRVVAVGANVEGFEVGQDVFGLGMHGAHAEFLAVESDSAVAPMPEGLTYAQAAAVPYGALTAWTFLKGLAPVDKGQRVLVVGGTGGVGRWVVQMARQMGAVVTAVCRAERASLARELGAHHTVDYTTTDFASQGVLYDMVFDTTGVIAFEHAQQALRPKGRFVSLHINARLISQALWTSFWGGQRVIIGVSGGDRESLEGIGALIERGALRPVVEQTYRLEEIAQAHERVEAGQTLGSVVVTVPVLS